MTRMIAMYENSSTNTEMLDEADILSTFTFVDDTVIYAQNMSDVC